MKTHARIHSQFCTLFLQFCPVRAVAKHVNGPVTPYFIRDPGNSLENRLQILRFLQSAHQQNALFFFYRIRVIFRELESVGDPKIGPAPQLEVHQVKEEL